MEVHHRHLFSMGTRFDLVIAGVESGACDQMLDEMRKELERIEGVLSIHRPDSQISLINSTAHKGPVELGSELQTLFGEILMLHKKTQGFFDITMKPVADFRRENQGVSTRLPEEICQICGMKRIRLESGGISFSTKGVVADMGGIGKGYAVKRLLPILESNGIRHALLSFGESLVFGWGTHPYGDSWKVSVPTEGGGEPAVFDLRNEALSTSGNTLNNQKKFGNSGHIVNPTSFQMVSHPGLVSVKSADPVRAEVYSTALFGAGQETAGEILKDASDLECRWIFPGPV